MSRQCTHYGRWPQHDFTTLKKLRPQSVNSRIQPGSDVIVCSEMDEQCGYVGAKSRQRWLFYAYDRIRRTVVAHVFGERTMATLEHLHRLPCGQAPENARPCSDLTVAPVRQHQKELPSLREGPQPENQVSYSIQMKIYHKTGAGLPARSPSPPLKSAAAPGRRPGVVSLLMMGVVTTLRHLCE